jgi:hypothetical protein
MHHLAHKIWEGKAKNELDCVEAGLICPKKLNTLMNFVYLKHMFNLKTFVFDYVRLNTQLM